jgi:hypothetical protein
MEPILHEALLEEAERVGVIDSDILAAYPEELKGAMLGADGKPDIASIVGAIRKIKSRVPALFKTQDFEQMDSADYQKAENAFRERLRRQSRPAERNNNFSKLDAALLSIEESNALRRFLGGNRSSYDRSLLGAALLRQQGPRDAA